MREGEGRGGERGGETVGTHLKSTINNDSYCIR